MSEWTPPANATLVEEEVETNGDTTVEVETTEEWTPPANAVLVDEDESDEDKETEVKFEAKSQLDYVTGKRDEKVKELVTTASEGIKGYTKDRIKKRDLNDIAALYEDENLGRYIANVGRDFFMTKGVSEKLTKEDLIKKVERYMLLDKDVEGAMSSTGKPWKPSILNKRNKLFNAYIPIDEAPVELEDDLTKVIDRKIKDEGLSPDAYGNRVDPLTLQPLTQEEIDAGADYIYENVKGYDVEEYIEEFESPGGYESGSTVNPVTGEQYINPEAPKQYQEARTPELKVFIEDENGELLVIKQGQRTYDNLETVPGSRALVDFEIYSPKVGLDNILKQQEEINNKLAIETDPDKIDGYNKRLAMLKSAEESMELESDAAATLKTAAANDKRGLFNASKSDYFEKDDKGNIKYNTFSPGNAVQEALANLAVDGFKYIGPQAIGTSMEVLEKDFNDSMWRGLGFWMEGGEIYSGVEFGKYGPLDKENQLARLKEAGLSTPLEDANDNSTMAQFIENALLDEYNIPRPTLGSGPIAPGDLSSIPSDELWTGEAFTNIASDQEDVLADQLKGYDAVKNLLNERIPDFKFNNQLLIDQKQSLELLNSVNIDLINTIGDLTPISDEITKIESELANLPTETKSDVKEYNKQVRIVNRKKERLNRKLNKSGFEKTQADLNTPIAEFANRDLISGLKYRKSNIPALKEIEYVELTLPNSGKKVKLNRSYLDNFGLRYSTIAGPSNAQIEYSFNKNLEDLIKINGGEIDYNPDLTSEEEIALIKQKGFSLRQMQDVLENDIKVKATEVLDAAGEIEVFERLLIDADYRLKETMATATKQSEFIQRAKERAQLSLGAPLTEEEKKALAQVEAREMTWGEVGSYALNTLQQRYFDVTGGALKLFLQGVRVVGGGIGLYDQKDLKQIDRILAQTDRDLAAASSVGKIKINSEVEEKFNQSIKGQALKAFVEMIFDITTMSGLGTIGRGKQAFNKVLKAKSFVGKGKGGLKEVLKYATDLNPTMALATYSQNQEYFNANKEWDNVPEWQKMFYSTGTAFIIGKLDKLGIEATLMKGGDKLVNNILGRVLSKAKPGADLKKLSVNEIKEMIGKGLIKIGGGAAGELVTEELQSVAEWGAQDLINLVNKFDGTEGSGFVNPDWGSEQMYEEMIKIAKVTALAAGPISVATASYNTVQDARGRINLRKLSDLNKDQFQLVTEAYTPEMMNSYRRLLESKVNDPTQDYTLEEMNAELKVQEEIADIVQKIPVNLPADARKEAYSKLAEIKELKEGIYKVDDQGNVTNTLDVDKNLVQPQLDRITQLEEELQDLSKNVIEDRKKKIKKEAEKAQAAVEDAGVETDIIAADNKETFTEELKKTLKRNEGETDEEFDERAKEEAESNYGFYETEPDPETGRTRIILNLDDIAQDNKITTKNHEVFHAVLAKVLQWDRGKDRIALANALKEKLMEIDPKTLGDSEFAQTLLVYQQDPKTDPETFAEETLALFSEAISTGDIKFNENYFTKIGDIIRRLLQRLSPDTKIGKKLSKIKFDSAQDVYNFIKDYNTSMEKGKFTKAQKKAIEKGVTVNLEEDTKELDVDFKYKGTRKRVKFKKKSNLQSLTESLDIDMSKPSGRGRFISETLTKTPQGKETFNFTESTLGQEIGPIVEATTKRLYDKVPQDLKRDITRNEFKNDLISLAGTLIQNEYDPSKQKLDAFVSNRLNLRANKLATDTFGQDFTEDVSEAKGIATEPTESVTIKEKTPTKQIKLKERLGDDAVKITEEVKQRGKDLDLETVDFKTLKDLTPEMTQEMFGISPKPGNLTKADVRNAQQFISKNADTLIAMLPEGSTPSGTSTGVQKVLLDAFYTKGDRVAMAKTGSKAGLKEQTKRDNITKEEFNELFGITPAGQPNLSDRNTSSRIKALVTQTGRMLTNQAIREQAETKGQKVPSKVFEGKSKVMWKKKADKVSKKQLEELINNKNVLETTDEVSLGEELIRDLGSWRTLVNAYSTKDKPIKALDLRDENDLEEYKGWVLSEFAKRLPKEFFKAAFFSGGRRTLESGALAWLDKADFNKSIKTVEEFGKPDQDIVNSTVRIRDGKVTIKDSKGESKTVKFGEKEFTEFNDSKLRGLKKVFEVFEEMIDKDPQNIKYIAQFLSSTSSNMGQFIRVASPTRFMQQNLEGKKTIEEHTLPVSFTAKYLLERAIEGNVDDYFYGIEQNFFQGLISKVNDDKLKDLPGEPKRKLAHFPPKDYAYDIVIGNDSIWLRYFNDFVNNNDNGFNSNEILLENGKTLAQEFKVEVDKKFQQDPNVVQFQNNLIKNLLLGEDIKAQKELNEFTKKLAGEKKKARRLNSKKLDKSRVIKIDDNAPTSEEIRQAEILDKALNIARDPNAPTKKIRVFDFDDTLARTKSNVLYTMPDGTKGKLTAEEFAKKGDKMLAEGAVWDFSEFNKVMKGKKGPLFEVAKKIQDTRGTKDVFVLTARAKEAAPAIKEFLDSVGLEIPLENITGLGDSSPLAKSGWIVDKAADGYNDFYFADDHLGNVDAVKKVLDVIDVKSKVQQAKVKFKKNVDKMMNNIIFEKTGIEQYKEFSEVGAQARGRRKRSFALIPSSAQDFGGLLYKLLGKGKAGDTQWQWMQENLIKPYGRAMNDLSVAQNQLMADFRELKNSLQGIPKNLKKKAFDGFTNEDVVRVVAWDRQGIKVDGLSKRDLDKMKKYVESKADLNIFVDELITITKGDGYHYPGASWLAGTITTDFIEGLRKTTRPKLLQQWQENVDLAFNESNMNKLEAAFGSKYREALENALERMKTGRNRRQGMGRLEQRFLDYLNNSVGAVMFLNARSAVLQTISAVNFVNWTDNNPIKAGAAFANQPQYWKDFIELMNSDFLVDRRNGLKINVSESEIAEAAKTTGNSVKGVISYLLNKGFVFTQIADSFAIASGGATFYRNRIKTYMKEGMSEAEAKEKAFLEFRDLAEESQQSSRADKISQQQASTLGRIVLAFANTPSQYARIMDKAGRDLINGRGDWKSNISKIMYYGFVQNLLFTTLQQAMFAMAGEEDEEEIEDKTINAANSMLDNILRGLGVQGTIISASKNVIVDLIKRSEKDPYFNPDADPFPGPKYEESVFKLIEVSPPLAIKLKKWRSGWLDYQFNRWRPEASDWFNINNPNYRAASKIIASVTNVPLDRLFQKIENIQGAMDETNEPWQRVAMFLGWPKWQLETTAAKEERKAKEKEQKKAIKAIDKPSIYTKEEQVNILKQYKLTDEEIKELKNEDLRVEKIKELRDSTKVIHTPKAAHLKPVVKDTLKPVTPKTDSTKVTFITTKPATKKSERKKITIENRTARQARLYKLSKANQIDTLQSLGVTPEVIKTLKYEEDRVRKIEELYDKD